MTDGFIFYRGFAEALEEINKADGAEACVEALSALMWYALDDKLPEEDLTGSAKVLFAIAKPNIDTNTKRRENAKKGAKYGKLGGRPKKEKSSDEAVPKADDQQESA